MITPHNRNPEPAEIASCEPYLHRQIELLQPRIILATGKFAATTLLRATTPIGRVVLGVSGLGVPPHPAGDQALRRAGGNILRRAREIAPASLSLATLYLFALRHGHA